MKRTALALTTIIALLFSAIAITPCVKLVSAQTFITIKADGSVSPSTPAIQQIGDLYILTSDIGGIDVERSNMMLDGNGHTLQGGVGGITLKSVKNVTVKNFIIKDCQYGVYLNECSNITVSNNTITGTAVPVPSELTMEILKSLFSELTGGIAVRGGNHDTIVGNRLEDNVYGMNLAVEDSLIIENNIINNVHGIELWNASNNTFYHNNFVDNHANVVKHDMKSLQVNTWDDGSFSGGNYWSNYNGIDVNGDGISGTPYTVCSNNQDRYPLMKPWEPDVAPPHIFISSPENKTYNDSNFTLAFSTSEPTSKISYSLDGQNNVTITGNTTLNKVPNGSHNLTVYATDHSGNTGASKTISFNVEVPEPFPTTLTATLGSIVAVACFGLLIYFKKRRKEAGEKA
jgi:parallel beta-helix repeat protein